MGTDVRASPDATPTESFHDAASTMILYCCTVVVQYVADSSGTGGPSAPKVCVYLSLVGGETTLENLNVVGVL